MSIALSGPEPVDFHPNRKSHLGAKSILMVIAIAIAGAVTVGGCSNPTAPPPPVSALAPLATELHNATDIFTVAVEDEALRGKNELAIAALGDQLLAGRVDGSHAALNQARALLVNLDDISAMELAPVGLALDYIERRINEIVAPT